jgi:competence protein ComEA
MPAWTAAERRGALLVALLLALGAARDLWRATHPRLSPEPASASVPEGGPAAAAADAERNAVPAVPRGTEPAPAGAAVDLNRAGLAELDALPGIGPVLARRIVAHRAAHGAFREPEDLLAVPGIGPRLLERLRPHVRAGPDSAPRSLPAPDPARAGVPARGQAGRPPAPPGR